MVSEAHNCCHQRHSCNTGVWVGYDAQGSSNTTRHNVSSCPYDRPVSNEAKQCHAVEVCWRSLIGTDLTRVPCV